MTRDLTIVSERALTADALAAGISAVHQGRPWRVTDAGGALEVLHCDQPLLRATPSVKLDGDDGAAQPATTLPRGRLWRTELSVIRYDEPLAVEVARAVAWEIGGNLMGMPD